MRLYTLILVLFLSVFVLNASVDSVYANRKIIAPDGVIPYNWIIKEYPEFGKQNFAMKNPTYTDKFWFSGFNNAGQFYISEDNLETWQQIKGISNNLLETRLSDCFVLPNYNIIFTLDTLIDKKPQGGVIYEYDYTNSKWKEHNRDIFKDKSPKQIRFKDNLNGILSVYSDGAYHLYKTEDGMQTWYRLDEISDLLSTDLFGISRMEYFKESNLLMCVVYNLNTRINYFIFSKDFGNSWTEMRIEAKINQGSDDMYSVCGFYNKGDSLWHATGDPDFVGDGVKEVIYFSPDLGKTWLTQYYADTPYGLDYFTSIDFFDNSSIGLAQETSPRVLITFDWGHHWLWLRDDVTQYGQSHYEDSFADYYYKWSMVKANNKMYFSGRNKVFILNTHIDPTTSVGEDAEAPFQAFYNSKLEAIELKINNTNDYFNNLSLYDITGKLLYTDNSNQSNQFYVTKEKLQNTKVVFAVINMNSGMHISKIICE